MMTLPNFNDNNEPNWEHAQSVALKTLLIVQQYQFPIRLGPIIEMFPNLHLTTYKHFSDNMGITVDDLIQYLGSPDGALWFHEDKGTYLLLFNDEITNEYRIRWTLAHELGHFFLRHNELSDAAILGRSSMSDSAYRVVESEANYFAKRLLAPLEIVGQVANSWGTISAQDIQYLFGISFEASSYYINELKQRSELIIQDKLGSIFNEYVDTIVHLAWCDKCETAFNSEIHTSCPTCGNSDVISLNQRNFSAVMSFSELVLPLNNLIIS